MPTSELIEIEWFPPSWVLVGWKDVVVYLDPAWIQSNFARYPKKVIFSHYPDPMDGLPDPDLPKADLILITHHHKDHQKKETVRRLSKPGTLIVGTSLCTTDLGNGIRVVKPGDEFESHGLNIRVVHAYNTAGGSSTRKVHHRGDCNGYLLTIKGRNRSHTIYHAGDTDYIPEMAELGDVEVAMLPIGGTFTMDIEEAVRATAAIHPDDVVPVHRGKADPMEFKRKVEAASLAEVVDLKSGEAYCLTAV
jgi:L-ascorbate metabolism protein UlaG (beta-lactamase superfamily)